MRCFICDRTLEADQVQYNQDHQDYDPCPSCLAVVEDILAGYKGQPDLEEDIALDVLIDGLFPPSHDPFEVDDFT